MRKVRFYIIVSVIALILLGLCIWWSISIYQQGYVLWLNEYNAQMAQFGFYKEDISLLDQHSAEANMIVQVIFNTFAYIVTAISTIGSYFIIYIRYY